METILIIQNEDESMIITHLLLFIISWVQTISFIGWKLFVGLDAERFVSI